MQMMRPMPQLLIFLLLLLLTTSAYTKDKSHNPYPNELQGFKLYAKYLAPLRPYVSDHASVVRVLGQDGRLELSGWKIWAYFASNRGLVSNPSLRLLAEITIKPKQRVSMLSMKFPAAFTHGLGGISETNISCDVYSDNFGLHYWLLAEDSKWGNKDDLVQIVYGPSTSR